MKAVRLLEYGGQLVFDDVPTPTIARDEVLVKIKSTAVNHLDLVEASGTARQILPIDLPWIPGHEFSKVVEQLGSDVAATASGHDGAYLKSIGASRVIDYREEQFEKVLRDKVDVVFNLIGGDTQQRSFLVLKEAAISSLLRSPYRGKRPRCTVYRA
jgi:NADPH:quinone reductase-like Zn-dependent oxidoreductase